MRRFHLHLPESRFQRIGIFLVIYIVISLFLGLFLTGLSAVSLQHQYFRVTRFSSFTAQALIFPYTFLPDQMFPSVHLWTSGLQILQEAPDFITVIETATHEFSDTSELSNTTFNEIDQELASMCLKLAKTNSYIPRSQILKVVFPKQKKDLEGYAFIATQGCDLGKVFIENHDDITGKSEPKTYLVLFQNDQELRPTGGFLGSFAIVTLDKGKLTQFDVQDIYVPDGQLPGRVDPPKPIQDAFLQGFWRLRDANWHPDAVKSSENIGWFFEKSGYPLPDGYIFLTYSSIEKVVEHIGGVYLPDYQETISHTNLYAFLQHEVEEDFFPGSTKKKDVLSSLSTQFLHKIRTLPTKEKLSLFTVLFSELKNKNVLLTSKNENLQNYFDSQKWSGNLQNDACSTPDCFQDYLHINDANLGVNKANCCIERTTEVRKLVTQNNSILQTEIRSKYTFKDIPLEVKKFTGGYKAFIRVYLPKDTSLTQLRINDQPYEDFILNLKKQKKFSPETAQQPTKDLVDNLQEFGFWIFVEEQSETNVDLMVQTPMTQVDNYQLTLQKQPGTKSFYNHWKIWLENEILFDDVLNGDRLFVVDHK